MFNDFVYLYVEDDLSSRETVTRILQQMMRVERLYMFENSADFMTRVKALPHKPDVILFDIHMAPITGFEMLKQLRQDPEYQAAKIIALTASVMKEEIELLKTSGFNGVFGKPIGLGQFPVLLARVIRGETIWQIAEN